MTSPVSMIALLLIWQTWFTPSDYRELPIDAGDQSQVYWEVTYSSAMDFRLGFPRIRVLPSREARLRSLSDGADHAEAWADGLRSKAEPVVEKLFTLRTRLATFAVGLLAVWLFMHVTFAANGMVVYRAKRAEYQALQKDIDKLQKENAYYTQEVNELKTDPKRIEKEAREQFHYARPGEVIYVSPDRPAAPAPSNRTARK